MTTAANPHSPRVLRPFLRGALLLCGLALAGCGGPVHFGEHGTRVAPERHAEASEAQHALHFSSRAATLRPGEASSLFRTLRALPLTSRDDIVVTMGSSGSDLIDQQRIGVIRKTLAPVPSRVRIVPPKSFTDRPDPHPDTALVQVFRYGRVRIDCPYPGDNFTTPAPIAEGMPFACANNMNIVSMAADARDVTDPGRLAATHSARPVKALEAFHKGEGKTVQLSQSAAAGGGGQ